MSSNLEIYLFRSYFCFYSHFVICDHDTMSMPNWSLYGNLFQASVLLEQNWSGKIYGESVECQYEKCNTPYTVAELKFGLRNGEDHYKVSVKDGFNRPITVRNTFSLLIF